MSFFQYFMTSQNLRELAIGLMFSAPTALSLGTQYNTAVGLAAGIAIFTLCLIWQAQRELITVLKIQAIRQYHHQTLMQATDELRTLLEEAKRSQAK